MSLEQLLFFLLLIAIPLVERLLAAMRERSSGSRDERPPVQTSEPAAQGLPPEPADHRATSPPPVPATRVPAATASLPPPARDVRHPPAKRPVSPTPAARSVPAVPSARLRRAIGGADLQRAMLLIAVFGPCRAIEPKDPTQIG